MIPKIFHQTWKTNTIPEEYVPYQKKLMALNPEWEYKLWTDEDNLELVKTHFPEFLDTYVGFPKNIMRADVIRYLIMYQVGGVYLDLDYEMLKPFDLLDYDLVLPYSRNISFGDRFDGFGNCVFASAPGYAFWKFAIDDFKKEDDYEQQFKSLADKEYMSKHTTLVEATTGPEFLTRIFRAHQDQLKNYLLPERENFHPPVPNSEKGYNKIVSKGVSYGIHHCVGTWRERSLLSRLKMGVKRILGK